MGTRALIIGKDKAGLYHYGQTHFDGDKNLEWLQTNMNDVEKVEKFIKNMDKELICSGDINQKFLAWLECNFGFYSSGILIDTAWDSNVISQYDSQRNCLRNSYNDFELDKVNKWSITKSKNNAYLLNFYEDELLWAGFELNWLSADKPDYVNFTYISEQD